jgi:cysteine desulfurase
MKEDMKSIGVLRDQFESGVEGMEQVYINGRKARRLPTVTNVSFRYTEGSALLASVTRDLAVSAGSACASASLEPSHVLTAMGRGRELAFATLRISLGRLTTEADMKQAKEILSRRVETLRNGSPTWTLFKKGQLGEAPEWSF